MVERKFSLYDIEQFIREAGAERITEDAVTQMEREIGKLAEQITNKAMSYAKHAGRKKLIRTSDILLAGKPEQAEYQSRPANLRPNASTTKSTSRTEI